MSRYDFGAVCAGDIATANFRLRNTANGRATITLLSVAGAGLTLSPKPALPLTLTAQGSADFTVAFQGSSTGGYSAALSTDGRSVLLTAAASGNQPLAASPADFGPVQVGQAQTLHVLVSNRMQQTLDVPPSQRGDKRFRLLGPAPSGTSLQPGKQAWSDAQFMPTVAVTRTGSLAIGARVYTLTGTGLAPPMPKPRFTVTFPLAQSAQQRRRGCGLRRAGRDGH